MSSVILNTTKVRNINVEKNGNTTSVTKVVDKNGRVLWQKGNYAPFSSIRLDCTDDGYLRIVIVGSEKTSKTYSISLTLHVKDNNDETSTYTFSSVSRTQNDNNNLIITCDSNNNTYNKHINTTYTYWVTSCVIQNSSYDDTEIENSDKVSLGISVSISNLTIYDTREYTGSNMYGITRNSSIHSITELNNYKTTDTDYNTPIDAVNVGTYVTVVKMTDTWHYWSDTGKRMKTHTWSIVPQVVSVTPPSLYSSKGYFIYNNEQQVIVYDYLEEFMEFEVTSSALQKTLSFDTKATGFIKHKHAGYFTLRFTLKFKSNYSYVWSNANVDSKAYRDLDIDIRIGTPTTKNNLFYTGSSQIVVDGYYSDYMYVSSRTPSTAALSVSQTNVCSNGTLTFSLATDWSSYSASPYVWEDGSRGVKTVSWSIAKKSVTEPKAISNATYNSGNDVRIISGYDSSLMTTNSNSVSGTYITYKNAGSGSDIYFELLYPDNYYWASHPNDTRVYVPWTLNKATVAKPTTISGLTYTGSNQNIISGYNSSLMTSNANNTSGQYVYLLNAGSGTVTFTLIDSSNYQWSGTTSVSVEVSWSISKKKVPIPVGRTNVAYTGNQVVVITGCDFSVMDIDSYSATVAKSGTTVTHKNTGSNYVYFKLLDTSNYQWSDGTTGLQKVTYSIK